MLRRSEVSLSAVRIARAAAGMSDLATHCIQFNELQVS